MPNFQIPERIKIDEDVKHERFGRYILEPLERGFGITTGNAIRRVLLSSIPGAAITALRIDGVLHEFSTIDGVIEDVTLIILNLKKVRVRLANSKPIKLTLKLQGPADITAGMLSGGNPNVEIMNPEQHIMTIEEEKNLNLDLWIGRGRGYFTADNNKTADAPLDTIWIDSIFSPIVKVNYFVEKLQSGVKEDLERLVLEVTTDGTMTPQDAVSYSSKLLADHLKPFFSLQSTDVIEPEQQIDEDKMRIRKQLMRSIDELELSVRSYNCLQAAEIKTIADLVSKEENEMLRFKNFGRKSLNELIEKLDELGLRFGMDISEYVKDINKK